MDGYFGSYVEDTDRIINTREKWALIQAAAAVFREAIFQANGIKGPVMDLPIDDDLEAALEAVESLILKPAAMEAVIDDAAQQEADDARSAAAEYRADVARDEGIWS